VLGPKALEINCLPDFVAFSVLLLTLAVIHSTRYRLFLQKKNKVQASVLGTSIKESVVQPLSVNISLSFAAGVLEE